MLTSAADGLLWATGVLACGFRRDFNGLNAYVEEANLLRRAVCFVT
jgi:hypothetical protein